MSCPHSLCSSESCSAHEVGETAWHRGNEATHDCASPTSQPRHRHRPSSSHGRSVVPNSNAVPRGSTTPLHPADIPTPSHHAVLRTPVQFRQWSSSDPAYDVSSSSASLPQSYSSAVSHGRGAAAVLSSAVPTVTTARSSTSSPGAGPSTYPYLRGQYGGGGGGGGGIGGIGGGIGGGGGVGSTSLQPLPVTSCRRHEPHMTSPVNRLGPSPWVLTTATMLRVTRRSH